MLKDDQRRTPERVLLALVLRTFGGLPNVRLWRTTPGLFTTRDGRRLRAGIPGMADVLGIVGPWGRLLSIELKAADGRVTPSQESWGRMIVAMGGVHVVARTVEDVRAALEIASRPPT